MQWNQQRSASLSLMVSAGRHWKMAQSSSQPCRQKHLNTPEPAHSATSSVTCLPLCQLPALPIDRLYAFCLNPLLPLLTLFHLSVMPTILSSRNALLSIPHSTAILLTTPLKLIYLPCSIFHFVFNYSICPLNHSLFQNVLPCFTSHSVSNLSICPLNYSLFQNVLSYSLSDCKSFSLLLFYSIMGLIFLYPPCPVIVKESQTSRKDLINTTFASVPIPLL